MKIKTKTFLGISFVIASLLAATILMTSCGNSETENSQAVPQTTADTTDLGNNATEKPIESTPQDTQITTRQDGLISKEDAKKIALDHAKVSEADAKFLKADLDYDDGVRVYEVDFESQGFEYDYDINAKTGEIMKFDKERD